MTQTATPDTAKPLTPKRQRFVDEYLVDLNATQAAIRAGYSERTAYSIGNELLSFPEVQLAIQEAQAQRSERTQVTADQVVDELARVAFATIADVVEWDEDGVRVKTSATLPPDVMAAVAGVTETRGMNGATLRLKMHDKLAALNLLAKHLGMFTDKVELRGHLSVDVHVYDEYSMAQLERMEAALQAQQAAEAVEVPEGQPLALGDGTPPIPLNEG